VYCNGILLFAEQSEMFEVVSSSGCLLNFGVVLQSVLKMQRTIRIFPIHCKGFKGIDMKYIFINWLLRIFFAWIAEVVLWAVSEGKSLSGGRSAFYRTNARDLRACRRLGDAWRRAAGVFRFRH
jgi:hypothetical protein